MSRPRPRRVVQLAGVAAAALLAGLLPGTDSAATGAADGVSLAYTCQFGAGQDPQDISVGIKQTYPSDGAVGKPIQPGDLTLTVGIPRAAVTALVPAEAATLSGSTDMKANVTQGTSRTVVVWPDLTAQPTTVAGSGDLDLVFTGKVPGVSVTAGGDLVFAAGDLDLTLHPQAATSTPTDPGTPTPDPSTGDDSTAGGAGSDSSGASADTSADTAADTSADTSADDSGGTTAATPTDGGTSGGLADITGLCAAKAGQDITLGTVAVPGGTGSTPSTGASTSPTGTAGTAGTPSDSASSSAGTTANGQRSTIVPLDSTPPRSGRTDCDAVPEGDLDPKRLPPTSSTAIVLPLPGMPAFPDSRMCAYAVGYANVGKLNGAMIINDPNAHPVLANVNSGRRKVLDYTNEYVEIDSLLSLELPPSHADFLTFGFMPTSAEVEFVPKGLMTVVQTGDDYYDQPILTTIGGYQDIRIRDVKINGESLDVGSDCHTASPVDVVLKGRKRPSTESGTGGLPNYDIADGGPLVDDDLTVPPFTGCVTPDGDNLNALFTASLSGSGNTLNIVQAPLCSPDDGTTPQNCNEPDIPLPQLPVRAGATK